MKMFLVCNQDGCVINVALAEEFERAYKNTIGENNGEILVELDDETLRNIEKLKEDIYE